MSETKRNLDKAAREFEQWVRDELHAPVSQPVEHERPTSSEKRVTVELIDGEAGRCIGINEYRVCGPKPVHGVVVMSWKATRSDVLRAFLTPDEKHDWLAKDLTVVPIEQARLVALVPGLVGALQNLSAVIVAIQDNSDARFSSETKKAIRDADAALSAVAKESRV